MVWHPLRQKGHPGLLVNSTASNHSLCPQRAAARAEEVEATFLAGATELIQGLHRLQVVVSSKSTITASSDALSKPAAASPFLILPDCRFRTYKLPKQADSNVKVFEEIWCKSPYCSNRNNSSSDDYS